MQYLVTQTEAEAIQLERDIFREGEVIAESAGYQVTDGQIIAKCDGKNVPEATGTRFWAIPQKTLDDRWAMPSPFERWPGRAIETSISFTIEEEIEFPVPEGLS